MDYMTYKGDDIWGFNGKHFLGLVRRREEEKKLFFEGLL